MTGMLLSRTSWRLYHKTGYLLSLHSSYFLLTLHFHFLCRYFLWTLTKAFTDCRLCFQTSTLEQPSCLKEDVPQVIRFPLPCHFQRLRGTNKLSNGQDYRHGVYLRLNPQNSKSWIYAQGDNDKTSACHKGSGRKSVKKKLGEHRFNWRKQPGVQGVGTDLGTILGREPYTIRAEDANTATGKH